MRKFGNTQYKCCFYNKASFAQLCFKQTFCEFVQLWLDVKVKSQSFGV